MFQVSRDMLQHLALLSQIDLAPDKEESLLEDLNHILQTFETINRVEEPPEQFSLGGTPLRNDEAILDITEGLIPDDRLVDRYVAVKPTLEE